jgi:ribosomal-protein-serine acetyltransferase
MTEAVHTGGGGVVQRFPVTMFNCNVNNQTELRLIRPEHVGEVFRLLDANREHLRPWHPWVDAVGSLADAERVVDGWERQAANNFGWHAGIWFEQEFSGMINHLIVDWPNRCTALSYWLAKDRQGRGIMTACCRAMIAHGFDTWKLNRITIECATKNTRSRAIPERLRFKLEGIVREVEWLQDHFADHALYGLLRSEHDGQSTNQTPS